MSFSSRCGAPLYGIFLTSVQRAKWMNDRRASVPLDFGNVVANQNTSGSHSRPARLTVLNTVIAIAWPSTFAGAVPVVVTGPGGAAGSLNCLRTYSRASAQVKALALRPRSDQQAKERR